MGLRDGGKHHLSNSLLVAIVVSLLSLFLILHLTVTKETLEVLREISPYYLAGAILLHLAGWVAWGGRIRVMSGAIESSLRMRDTLRIVVASLFTAAITPSHAGGEPVRVYLISKDGGVSLGDASAIVLLERLLDLIFFIVISPFAILLFKDLVFHTTGGIRVILGVSLTLLSIAIIIIIQILRQPEWIKNRIPTIIRIIRFFVGSRRSDRIATRISIEIDAFINSLRMFTRLAKGRVFVAWILTVTYWALEFMIPCFILMGLGEDPEFVRVFASQIILMTVVLIPLTPGSSGFAEFGFTTLFSVFVRRSVLGLLVVTWRFITYYLNIIAGGLLSLHIIRKR